MAKKKEAATVKELTGEELTEKSIQVVTVKNNLKQLKKKEEELVGILKPYVTKFGYEDPNTGNKLVEVPWGSKKLILKNQKSISKSLRNDYEMILKKYTTRAQRKELYETVQVLRTDRLEQMYLDKEISEEAVLKIYELKENYSFYVNVEDNEIGGDGEEETED
jgi:hypothetical protein